MQAEDQRRDGPPFAGRYRLQERLPGDAAVEVCEALDEDDFPVVLRILRPSFASNQARIAVLFGEAITYELVDHPAFAKIVDANVLPTGEAYVAREWVPGATLRTVLEQRQRLPEEETLAIVSAATEALAAAHAVGVHFRSLRPECLLLAPTGGGAMSVRIIGLGVRPLAPPSVVVDPDPSASYVAPEQIVDPAGGDARCDVWALGVMTFELLAGRPPWSGATTRAVHTAVMAGAVPALAGITQVSAGLAKIVSRCLQVRAGDRYASAADLARDLHLLGEARASSEESAPLSSSQEDPRTIAARHAPTVQIARGSKPAVPAAAPSGSTPGEDRTLVQPRHARTALMVNAPARWNLVAAPLQLRTRFAYEVSAFAELFNSVVGRIQLGSRGYRPSLTSPQGPSTGGGEQSRQHIRLVSDDARAPVIVVGWADLRTKSAELHSFALMDRRLRRRLGARIQIDANAYLAFLARAAGFFEAAHVATTITEAAPVEDSARWRAAAGFAAGAFVVVVALVCAVLAFR